MGTNFTDDGLHAFLTGTMTALLMREAGSPDRTLTIKGVWPEQDRDGDYKPIITVEMESGRKFRIIVAEVT